MFIMESVGKSGGLALFWEDECEMEIQSYSHRHIIAIVHHQQLDWKFTGFYGHPDAKKRFEVWNLLKFLLEWLRTYGYVLEISTKCWCRRKNWEVICAKTASCKLFNILLRHASCQI